jgi:hypothetical protein
MVMSLRQQWQATIDEGDGGDELRQMQAIQVA